MKRLIVTPFVLGIGFLCLATAGFGDTFTYGFNGPSAILAGPGETVSESYEMAMECSAGPRPRRSSV